MQSEIAIRSYEPEDESFVFSSWLNSYQKNSVHTEAIPKYTFFKFHHGIITRLVKRSTITIACLKEDPGVVIGYLVREDDDHKVIHFCYVKSAFRRMGIAKSLVKEAGINPEDYSFTHHTYPVDWWISKKYPNMTFNPYIII